MRRILILIYALNIAQLLSGQSLSTVGQPTVSLDNIIPKSPQVAQLERVNDITINSARGTPNISFNLYTASVGNMKIPISISYDASGIKYDDVPTVVGLKWS